MYQSMVQGLGQKQCPFCRTPYPKDDAEAQKLVDKQLERQVKILSRFVTEPSRAWKKGTTMKHSSTGYRPPKEVIWKPIDMWVVCISH